MKHKLFLFFAAVFIHISLQAQLTLEDIWKTYTYYPFGFSNTIHDAQGTGFYILESNSVLHVPYTADKAKSIVNFSDKTDQQIQSIVFSSDNKTILAAVQSNYFRRNSFSAMYLKYSVDEDTLIPMFVPNIPIQKPTFSPVTNQICYFYQNNLYLYDSIDSVVAITTDGKSNEIINGMPDWVSEEEFDIQQAFLWSPIGTHIDYLQWDEKDVPTYTIPKYNNVYPEQYTYKYPKAGETPARMYAKIYSITDKETITVSFPKSYVYIPEFSWIDSSRIAFTLVNRLQNQVDIAVYSLQDSSCIIVYSHASKTFVDIPTYFTHIETRNTFIVRNDSDGFLNLYEYPYNSGFAKQLTKNIGDVTNVYGYFSKSNSIFYQATNNNPLERFVYELSCNTKESRLLSSEPGTHSIDINSQGTGWIREYSNKNPQLVTYIEGVNLEKIREPFANFWMKELAENLEFSEVEYFTIPTENNEYLNASLIKPKNFKKHKTYPVIVQVYGGPGMQKVTNEWTYEYYWNQYLAQHGYIVVSVDCRGTDARGSAFRKQTYCNLGDKESFDFAQTARYLRSLPYVSKQHIAIQGWSYGAYMALLTAAKFPDSYNAVIAIAPVTNWLWYDNIYTERYMQIPTANEQGYAASSVFTYIQQLTAPVLLAHGTADDNVHMQHSYELISKLIAHDKQFDLLVFPNNEHSLFGENSRMYLYSKYLNFLEMHFKTKQ